MKRQIHRQRLELCCHNLGNIRGYQKLEETRKDPPPEVLQGARLSQHLDFRLVASTTVREYISAVFNHSVCGNLLWQPQEMDTQ